MDVDYDALLDCLRFLVVVGSGLLDGGGLLLPCRVLFGLSLSLKGRRNRRLTSSSKLLSIGANGLPAVWWPCFVVMV